MGAVAKQWNAARGLKEAQHCWCGRVTELVRVMSKCTILPSVPGVGCTLWVGSVGLRWARDKRQHLSTCGRRLGDVVTDSCRGHIPAVWFAHA